jgi:hypothetical protein
VPTFHVCVTHVHDADLSLESGKLVAADEGEARWRSELWIRRKLSTVACRKPGSRCRHDLKRLAQSDGAGFLLPTAEEIL